MFGVPAPTEFDLRFRLLRIFVRVNPFFWVIAAFLGKDEIERGGTYFLIWIGCVFVSILVHEFGHALTSRMFGADPEVLLHGMGGLCIYQNSRETLRQRLMVILMGPVAGFLLMGLTIAIASLYLRISPNDVWNYRLLGGPVSASVHFKLTIIYLIQINFYWGIFNLLPIMPLDGGQLASLLLTAHNSRQGRRRGYILSILTAGLLAFYFVRIESYYNALLVGVLALNSYQVLQAYHYQSKFGDSYEDEADWWKR